ncbi:peptidase M50 [Gregarina niphandrodes]|uniref:Peptidase M50 n=1 Tax=Gregarina niphandrodes TaxID=110365 RepID=A0A023B9J6_GRENI|nr:peptidase M50 [Gregarina niphandrodes]EZG72960.1 peptidase M50 [Gregarina niphandrodes]|eukprot:XP_011129719.1 peptidase M50 [Gregarina niphandrodes]
MLPGNLYSPAEPPNKFTPSLVFIVTVVTFVLLLLLGSYHQRNVCDLVLVGWVLSTGLHEYAHALTAYIGGDRSILAKGYLDLNFLRYIDVTTSIVLPIMMIALGGIALPGAAVMIQSSDLPSAHWDALVSAAGPLGTLVSAVLFRVLMTLLKVLPESSSRVSAEALSFLVEIEFFSLLLNLLPLPPLDGWGIVSPYLSNSCGLKAYLDRSPWNRKTASLITFFVVFVVFSLPPMFEAISSWANTLFLLNPLDVYRGHSRFLTPFD